VLCMGSLVNPNSARNPTLLVLAGALRAALFPIPVITIFWQEEIGMSLRDILLLQAIFAVTTLLFEFHAVERRPPKIASACCRSTRHCFA
jgi:hypothetical protein